MWIPHTDAVVVVTLDELPPGQAEPPPEGGRCSEDQALAPLRQLLAAAPGGAAAAGAEAAGLSATQLRDRLLAAAPLSRDWVAHVNAAEAEYWRRAAGARVGWSDELLGFDCGGQQWVLETAFPAGSLAAPDGADLAYMEALLSLIEAEGLPAPAPIEQRWTAGSASGMSPAAGTPGSLHSWVGIIMYLPEGDEPARAAVTQGCVSVWASGCGGAKASPQEPPASAARGQPTPPAPPPLARSFKRYAGLVERHLMPRFGAVEHWAKIEPPAEPGALAAMRARLAARYPLAQFNAARARLDPMNVLGSPLVDAVLPREGGGTGGGGGSAAPAAGGR